METILWKGISMLSLIVSFIALIIGIVGVDKATILLSSETAAEVSGGFPKSCREIKGSGSGLHTIQPDPNSPAFQVFCDMDVAGGGWTLVASVHENNIDGKCTSGDKWSSEQGSSNNGGSKNWENKNVFGQIETITDQDYKNPGYYSIPANDIMIWHVPNGKKAYEISNSAFLKYYTTSKFLNNTNMQYLYKNKFPIQTAVGGLNPLLTKIQNASANVTGNIPFWYNYRYDGGRTSSSIRDGGGDMYDGGNAVSFGTDRENFTLMTYNTPYFYESDIAFFYYYVFGNGPANLYGSGVEVKSGTNGWPFLSLAWIGDGLGDARSDVEYFQYRVISNFGADGRGSSLFYDSREVSLGQMKAVYTAFLVANASDPSICEVYFYITNRRWKSREPREIQRIGWDNQTRDARNIVRFTGHPSNLLIGYTLLSKFGGRTIFRNEIDGVLKRYMALSETFNFKVLVPHQVEKVTFAKGTVDDVKNSVPRLHRDRVVPGNIQFRAFNSVGLPNALCPGVSVKSDNPEQMCIGGSSTALRDLAQCGDFAGWKGIPGDPGSQDAPSGTGKSLNDINSSILIFTR